jgi:hypothetical protein
MAYLEPLRVSIVGDKIAGARYIRDARRIAFGLLRQLREGGVLSGRRLYKNDATGVTIEVVVAGAIVAATIYTAGGGRFTQFPQGFVVWPRDGNHVDGIDEEFPQLLLEPPDEEADDPAWATLFKSAAIDGFQEFSYQKGVYGAHYIGGLRRAGNIDWVGPDGERLSWYGPQVRAWYDGWVQPDKQFGKFVFMMGQPLLDVEKYIEESADSPSFDDRYVLGAALYKTGPASASLYVVHMELEPFPPEVPSPSAVGKFTSLVGGYGLPAGLYRYSLIMVADANGLPRYKVVPNSRQLLQSIPDVAREPWFFNKDATKAICLSQRAFSPLGVNDNRTFYYAYSRTPYNAGEQPSEGDPEWIDALTDPDDDTPYWFPQQTQTKIVLSIDHENEDAVTVANTMVTAAVGGAPAPIALDYDHEGNEVSLDIRIASDRRVYLLLGENELPINEFIGADDVYTTSKRWVLHANLRDGIVVVLRTHLVLEAPSSGWFENVGGEGSTLEVWKDGVLASSTHLASGADVVSQFKLPSPGSWRTIFEFLAPTDVRDVLRLIDDRNFAPHFFVHGVYSYSNVIQPPDPIVLGAELFGLNATGAGPCMPSEVYFGAWDDGSIFPTGGYSRGGFAAAALDFDGHPSCVGVAADGEDYMLSIASPHGDVDRSVDFVHSPAEPRTLSTLTAVAGGDRRYHPIWVVGAHPEPPTNLTPGLTVREQK